ncbi:helix-turn-helix domain-containing protein [uncultured Deinococcus sp.]|uniref:XRE family transcriptional regulator n=1 Tax=uncultured Deinococcus sp. TaxID=158789 RepID=UPI0025856C88|nr:helix-turn-helix domain-containing protein [uncultured Deinococcus sp.]
MTTQSTSPSQHLKELLEERGWKNATLAERMGRSPQYVTDIIKGKKVMDVDLAIELGAAIPDGPTASVWMEYAIAYRQASAQPTRPQVLEKHEYAKDLIKLKWVDGSKNPVELDKELEAFWALKGVAANFRTSLASSVNDIAKRAWAIQVYRQAIQNVAVEFPVYDEKKLPKLFADLKRLMRDPAKVKQIKPLIESYGIRLVYLPNPKQCAVDGIASYNSGVPYIGLSLRIARFDSFVFTLWHELMHIAHQDSNMRPDVIDAPIIEDEIERRANEKASEYILSNRVYKQFVTTGDFSFKAIEQVALDNKIHHSVLLGRLKRDHILDWSQFAREHPGVRDALVSS